jgi:O-antigen ligase
MMQETLLPGKWGQYLSYGMLFLCLMAFAYTGNYILAALPLGFLFVLLLGINWKAAYFILLATIPVSYDLSFFNNSLSTSVPDEPMMWLFFLLFMVMMARNPKMIPDWWWRNPLVLVLALQFLWLLVAVLFSREPLYSVKFLLAKTWFLVTFFVIPIFIFRDKKDFRLAFLLVLIPLLITMLIINARHAALGFHFRKVEKAIGDIYFNHVDYSTLMSMLYPLVWISYPLTKGKSPIFRGVVLALIVFFLPAIYLTYARAALLAIVFATVIGIAIRMKLVNLIMPGFYLICGLVFAYMINHNKYIDFRPNYEKTYMHKHFTDHMIATIRGEDMSSMERLYRWIAAVRMSQDEPVTGFGPNSFYYYYKPYTVTSFKTYVSRNPEQSTTHNYFLYMLVEQGWPGMILYGLMVFAVFWQAQRIYHRFKDRFYKWATLGIIMMFAAGFINNFFSELLETHKIGSLFYLTIALLVVLRKKSYDLQNETSPEVAA